MLHDKIKMIYFIDSFLVSQMDTKNEKNRRDQFWDAIFALIQKQPTHLHIHTNILHPDVGS